MRIALFTESYDPIINGVSTSVKALVAHLPETGIDPIVVAPFSRGPRAQGYSDPEGAAIIRVPSWISPFNPENPFAYPPFFGVPKSLRNLDADIVHTQQPFGMGLHGRDAARRIGVPLISTFHTMYHEYTHYFPLMPKVWLQKLLFWHYRRYYGACDAVIVPSETARRILSDHGVSKEKLHVVPTGVSQPRPVSPSEIETVRAEFGFSETTPVILYVGRLAPEKGIELLIDALIGLGSPENPPILLLVGSGPAREGIEEYARRKNVAGRVRCTGYQPRDRLAPIYAAATLFAFPSVTDTQGVVLSEAQSYGLPCVVADGGGAPEFIRDGIDALLVDRDAEAFRAALDCLLRDPKQRAKFSAAARTSDKHPSPERMAREIAAVYRNVLGERKVVGSVPT